MIDGDREVQAIKEDSFYIDKVEESVNNSKPDIIPLTSFSPFLHVPQMLKVSESKRFHLIINCL